MNREDVTFEYWTTAKTSVRKVTHKDGESVEFEQSKVSEADALAALEAKIGPQF